MGIDFQNKFDFNVKLAFSRMGSVHLKILCTLIEMLSKQDSMLLDQYWGPVLLAVENG